jgi:two-component system LytT family response regulator
MISCIIVDDEPYSIDTLSDYISKSNGLRLLKAYSNSLDAINNIQNWQNPDIIFLDIDMPDLTGLEFAELLPENIAVIYVTAHAEYALKAFDTNVYDFLLKPVSFAKFLKSVQKVKSMLEVQQPIKEKTSEYFFINPGVKGKVIKINFDEIIYIQGLKNYVVIYILREKHITYLTMKEIEDALPPHKFLRIHKSFIINLFRIQCIEGNTVIMSEHLNLPVGGAYKKSLINLINNKSVLTKR